MSEVIFKFTKSFINERLSAEVFANAFMELWKIERDTGIAKEDSPCLSDCLSSIFCLADMYNPNSDREEYELDEDMLRDRVYQLITNFKKL